MTLITRIGLEITMLKPGKQPRRQLFSIALGDRVSEGNLARLNHVAYVNRKRQSEHGGMTLRQIEASTNARYFANDA